jgi:hypothetical protein
LSSWTQETDLVHQLFGGYLRSQLKCKCGAVSNSFESLLDLSLEINDATDTLEETLGNEPLYLFGACSCTDALWSIGIYK